MTLVIPTASSIKMRFPEFASVDDSAVEFAIEEARAVFGDGTNWADGADLALVYLCAHHLSCARANAAAGGAGGQRIASRSIGRISVSYAQDSGGSQKPEVDDLDTTSYGKRYQMLVEGNFSGPRIV